MLPYPRVQNWINFHENCKIETLCSITHRCLSIANSGSTLRSRLHAQSQEQKCCDLRKREASEMHGKASSDFKGSKVISGCKKTVDICAVKVRNEKQWEIGARGTAWAMLGGVARLFAPESCLLVQIWTTSLQGNVRQATALEKSLASQFSR